MVVHATTNGKAEMQPSRKKESTRFALPERPSLVTPNPYRNRSLSGSMSRSLAVPELLSYG